MSIKEINNLDPEDIGLQQVMGNRFKDNTKQPMVEPFPSEVDTSQEQKAMDAQWEPIKEYSRTDDLKECAKSSFIFGGLNMLIWYWQISGLMDESIALPSMLVCAALFGLGIGKCCKRGKG